MKSWTKEEDLFIIENYDKMFVRDIAKILERTYESLASHIAHRKLINRCTEEQIKRHNEIFNNYLIERNKKCLGDKNPNWKKNISKNNYHYKRIQIERFPEKIKARDNVYHAVKSGRLKKESCKECGSSKNIQAHHEDYLKPLEVIWLCRKCHNKLHHNN